MTSLINNKIESNRYDKDFSKIKFASSENRYSPLQTSERFKRQEEWINSHFSDCETSSDSDSDFSIGSPYKNLKNNEIAVLVRTIGICKENNSRKNGNLKRRRINYKINLLNLKCLERSSNSFENKEIVIEKTMCKQLKKINHNYDLFVIQESVSWEDTIIQIDNIASKFGKISLVVLDGHGNDNCFSYGSDEEELQVKKEIVFSSELKEKTGDQLKNAIAPNGNIWIDSCNAANGFAKALLEVVPKNVTIHASTRPVTTDNFKILSFDPVFRIECIVDGEDRLKIFTNKESVLSSNHLDHLNPNLGLNHRVADTENEASSDLSNANSTNECCVIL